MYKLVTNKLYIMCIFALNDTGSKQYHSFNTQLKYIYIAFLCNIHIYDNFICFENCILRNDTLFYIQYTILLYRVKANDCIVCSSVLYTNLLYLSQKCSFEIFLSLHYNYSMLQYVKSFIL